MGSGNKWTKEEIEILKENYCKIEIDKIVQLIPNHSRSSICKRASDLKITNRFFNQSNSQRIYKYNFNFFDEPNICNSYWAGFIAADGFFSKDGCVGISLSNKDDIINQTFKNHVQYNGKIKYVVCNGKTFAKEGSIYSRLHIWGAYRWQEKLNQNWNIPFKDKTHNLIPPDIKDIDLIYAYIIGLIDGDGSIYYTHLSKYPNNRIINISICGTYKIVEWVGGIWGEIINKNLKIRLNGHSKCNYFIRISSNQAKRVCEKLLMVDIPWKLERKWIKIA